MSFQRTKIEYLTHTWNPITMRCTPISEGCKNCWHQQRAKLLANNPKIEWVHKEIWKGNKPPELFDLHIPKGKGRRRIGCQFMGDLFHEDITLHMLRDVFNIIKKNPDDYFLLLTKRPERIPAGIDYASFLPNAWFGVTVESPKYRWRIEKLLQIQAAVRWVSMEPMLEEIDLTPYFALIDSNGEPYAPRCNPDGSPMLSWVVCGAETGPGKRPMDIMWAADLLAQCKEAGIPFFFKKDSQGKYDPNFPREYPK